MQNDLRSRLVLYPLFLSYRSLILAIGPPHNLLDHVNGQNKEIKLEKLLFFITFFVFSSRLPVKLLSVNPIHRRVQPTQYTFYNYALQFFNVLWFKTTFSKFFWVANVCWILFSAGRSLSVPCTSSWTCTRTARATAAAPARAGSPAGPNTSRESPRTSPRPRTSSCSAAGATLTWGTWTLRVGLVYGD